MGPDGHLHSTAFHSEIDHKDFCIEGYYDNETDYYYDSESECFGPQNDLKESSIMIFYCTENLRKLRKCCPQGENLNLNGESCTDHLAEEDDLGQTFIKTAMVIILVQQVDICNLGSHTLGPQFH